jgi:hypothetical protein
MPANTPINKDTSALIQRGVLQQPGFYGSQEMRPSNDGFNNAVGIGAQLAGFASLLQQQTAPANYVRTPNNYILTAREHNIISSTAQQLASFGVIPYDTLTNFFYILAASENYSDLQYIAQVVNLPDLDNPYLVRNISGICAIPDIYKIGYLSQGVASIIQTFAPQYNSARSYSDYGQSTNGSTFLAADLGTSLGVIGASIIGTAYNNNAWGGTLSNAPQLSSSAINSSINSYATIANGNGSSLLPSTIGAILNPAATLQSDITAAGASAISGLLGQSPLGGALGSLGSLGGIVAGMLLGKSGGGALGGLMSEIITGNRISTSRRANNPMLTPPSYAGKSFFGEAPVSLPAVDQVFCRRVGAFGTMNGGSGVVSFGMQNYNSFGGSQSITSIVSRLITGSPDVPPTNTYYGQHVNNMTGNLCNTLNVPVNSIIEMRRSDNAIPFMLGFSAVMVGETFSPFGSKPFTEGWKLAASTGNDIQRYNPQFLRTCLTSL